ncbi:MAG: hypothetical protein ACK43K_05625, partial [Chitinophagales bacterium]
QVQGIDYAYTLQGWLKGINASTLNTNYDMGRDGDASLVGNINAKTATDAIALTLRYYQNDYKQIARTTLPVEATLPTVGLGSNPLYNGNIGSSIVSLKNMDPHGYQYTYDQLNRIVGMDVHKQPAVAANNMSAASLSPDYQERISYDPNGNILTYNRNMDNAANMDDLKYNYYYYPKGSNTPMEYDPTAFPTSYSPGDRVTNQLASVQDALGAPVLTGKDIGTQNPDNYKYDEIGNLIRDDQENMDIEWTPTGKIAKITNINKNLVITFAYDPMGNRIMKKVDDGGQIKLTYYTRDAQGNPLATYANHYTDVNTTEAPSPSQLWWIETPLYGSSRIGMVQPNLEVANATSPYPDWIRNYFKGKRQYELTNHLGNVLATIKDEKKQMQLSPGTAIDYFDPIVYTATDYYPFGMPMPNRTYSLSSSKYRFGFNGQEKDDEVYGAGNLNTAEFWQYDTRIGRRWNLDPVPQIDISDYSVNGNNPISFNDPFGDNFTNPNGKEVVCDDMFKPNADATKVFNTSTSGNKNWDYMTWNKENGSYDIHRINPSSNNIVSEDIVSKIASTSSSARIREIARTINEHGSNFGLNNRTALNHFLSQAAHESGGFRIMSENLNYSAKGLNKTFPKYFGAGKEDADDYARQPEKIANYVYGGRNGNNRTGDGYKYRGAGLIQLTGKANYTQFNLYLSKNMPHISVS